MEHFLRYISDKCNIKPIIKVDVLKQAPLQSNQSENDNKGSFTVLDLPTDPMEAAYFLAEHLTDGDTIRYTDTSGQSHIVIFREPARYTHFQGFYHSQNKELVMMQRVQQIEKFEPENSQTLNDQGIVQIRTTVNVAAVLPS